MLDTIHLARKKVTSDIHAIMVQLPKEEVSRNQIEIMKIDTSNLFLLIRYVVWLYVCFTEKHLSSFCNNTKLQEHPVGTIHIR